MRRRDFIVRGAVGAGALRSRWAAAEEQLRRIAFVAPQSPVAPVWIAAFEAGLQARGWRKGRNVEIDYRLTEASPDAYRAAAKDVLALNPELVVTQSTPATREILAASHTVPVVFVHVSDPIGSGFVNSFAAPGGNATGFTDIEASLGSKWLQLLKEAVPGVNHSALLFNPDTAPDRGEFFLRPFVMAAKSLGVAAAAAPVRSADDIEQAVAAVAAPPGGGFAVEPESFTGAHRDEIVALAAQFRVPAVYPYRYFAADGGLLAYGIDSPDLFRRAASYVDRILKGAQPAQLPVQQPTKFELVVNLKTAKALGLTVPQSLLARADEVIE